MFSKKKKRYPETTIEQMKEAQCEILMLSSEPYPFAHKHLEYFKMNCRKPKLYWLMEKCLAGMEAG
jgi:predicted Rossmann fold nucleotide-binding protein DprA/Smf involved in DNA uptake